MKDNRPPSDGLQFFGAIKVENRTKAAIVTLHDLSGKTLYRIELPPEQYRTR
jgi:alkaline phosphatase D